MKSIFWMFVAALCIATAWGFGYRTGSLDANTKSYSVGYQDGFHKGITEYQEGVL